MTAHQHREKLLGALKNSQDRLNWFYEKYAGMGADILGDNENLIHEIEAEIAVEGTCDTCGGKENIGFIAQTGEDVPCPECQPSPTNVIIRAAKRLIAALNLPEGGGVAFDRGRWRIFMQTAYSYENAQCWFAGLNDGVLPDGCLAPWPGDWRESWITRETPEAE